jgi:hypothetical protein
MSTNEQPAEAAATIKPHVTSLGRLFTPLGFGFRPSDFIRPSAFGFLISSFAALGAFAALVLGNTGCSKPPTTPVATSPPEVTFKPKEMADALHSVIAADREIYSRHILQRLATEEKLLKVSENWQPDKALPVPAQILRMGSEAVQQKGAEFHYILRSLWPINPRNAPETSTEKKGLEAVVAHPETNFYSEESLGGRRYFTAIYPDQAIVPSCVECHNTHEGNGKKDFKVGDVMGGMVVRVPLEF